MQLISCNFSGCVATFKKRPENAWFAVVSGAPITLKKKVPSVGVEVVSLSCLSHMGE